MPLGGNGVITWVRAYRNGNNLDATEWHLEDGMSGRGRKPQPAKLVEIKGTGNATRQKERTEGAPEPDANAVEKPKGLTARASRHWDKVVPELQRAGLATNVDVDALAMYVEAYARWWDANAAIDKHGTLILDQNGIPKLSPYVRVAEGAFKEMRQMLLEFGMTPSARNRVKAAPPEDDGEDQNDPWADFGNV